MLVYLLINHHNVEIIKYYIIINVEHVLIMLMLMEILVDVHKATIMILTIIYVIKLYKLVNMGNIGIMELVYVIMDGEDTMDNVFNAHHQVPTKYVYAQVVKYSM